MCRVYRTCMMPANVATVGLDKAMHSDFDDGGEKKRASPLSMHFSCFSTQLHRWLITQAKNMKILAHQQYANPLTVLFWVHIIRHRGYHQLSHHFSAITPFFCITVQGAM